MSITAPTQEVLLQALTQLHEGNVLIVGDIMVDAYLQGDASRISPEAPVPVVLVDSYLHVLGGAGNVANNIVALGGKATLIAVKGDDADGQVLENILEKQRITASLHTMPQRPTTVKTRIVAQRQQMLRFDREVATPHSTEESQSLLADIASRLPCVDSVIISDYGKGLVTAHLMAGILDLVAQQGRFIPVLVDPKPVNAHLYQGVTLLTPNSKETAECINMPVSTPEQIKAAGVSLMAKLQLPSLVTTLGPQGMAVFEKDSIWHIPTTAKRVFDVTGAGDTVIATTALALGRGNSLLHSCMLANYAAGIVVGEVGAATASVAAIKDAITQLPFTAPVPW